MMVPARSQQSTGVALEMRGIGFPQAMSAGDVGTHPEYGKGKVVGFENFDDGVTSHGTVVIEWENTGDMRHKYRLDQFLKLQVEFSKQLPEQLIMHGEGEFEGVSAGDVGKCSRGEVKVLGFVNERDVMEMVLHASWLKKSFIQCHVVTLVIWDVQFPTKRFRKPERESVVRDERVVQRSLNDGLRKAVKEDNYTGALKLLEQGADPDVDSHQPHWVGEDEISIASFFVTKEPRHWPNLAHYFNLFRAMFPKIKTDRSRLLLRMFKRVSRWEFVEGIQWCVQQGVDLTHLVADVADVQSIRTLKVVNDGLLKTRSQDSATEFLVKAVEPYRWSAKNRMREMIIALPVQDAFIEAIKAKNYEQALELLKAARIEVEGESKSSLKSRFATLQQIANKLLKQHDQTEVAILLTQAADDRKANKFCEMLEVLNINFNKNERLVAAIRDRNFDLAKQYLDAGADPNTVDPEDKCSGVGSTAVQRVVLGALIFPSISDMAKYFELFQAQKST